MFEHIVGNEKNKQLLENIIKENNISHSYMFIGKMGIGKLLFAKQFAQAILCESHNLCGKCKSCVEFISNNNPDIKIIEKEGTSNIKIEQIRDMNSKIIEKPIISSRKVYIINDADSMTKEAQNCLLKTLEEPPQYAVIILIGENENLFLNTIKSRCTKIIFQNIPDDILKNTLEEKFDYRNITKSMLSLFEGSIGRAVELQGKEEIYENIKNIFTNLEKINIIDLLNQKEIISKYKEDMISILQYVQVLFFEFVRLGDLRYIKAIEIIEDTKDRLSKNANFDMTIDLFLMSVWESINM